MNLAIFVLIVMGFGMAFWIDFLLYENYQLKKKLARNNKAMKFAINELVEIRRDLREAIDA